MSTATSLCGPAASHTERRRHFVLLNGGTFENKGDHLMLLAVLARLRQWGLTPVWDTVAASYEERARLSVYQRLIPRSRGRLAGTLGRWLMARYGGPYGIVSDDKCESILDFRGYAFGDVWKLEHARGAIEQFGDWHHAGVPVVLLPQAFGPFRSAKWRDVAQRLATTTRLCYARDSESFEALRECGFSSKHLRMCPDITFGVQTDATTRSVERAPYIVFIPNKWMLERVGPHVASGYLEWMRRMASLVRDRGFIPTLLPMTRSLDKDAVRIVMSGMPGFETTVLDDPLEVLRTITGASGVVTSRYHGLVLALACGRPTVATAWSHKYRTLMQEFGLVDGLVPDEEIAGRNPASADRLCAWIDRDEVGTTIRAVADEKRAAVERMWSEVENAIC